MIMKEKDKVVMIHKIYFYVLQRYNIRKIEY